MAAVKRFTVINFMAIIWAYLDGAHSWIVFDLTKSSITAKTSNIENVPAPAKKLNFKALLHKFHAKIVSFILH